MNKNREEFNKYFELLEVNPDASLAEIRKAYLHLKELYSTESIATSPLEPEIPGERKKEILEQIEKAYEALTAFFEEKRVAPKKDLTRILSEITVFSGQSLRQIRERLEIDLHDLALATKIQIRHLEDIEDEVYDSLPPEVYTRGFVISYARHLSLDAKKVADDYMKRYYAWKAEQEDEP